MGVQQEDFKPAPFYGSAWLQTSPLHLVNIEVYVTIPAFARTERNCMFISVALFWVLTVLSRPLLIFYLRDKFFREIFGAEEGSTFFALVSAPML